MSRSTEAQKAERLNAALGLLAGGQSVAEAAMSLSRRFAMSRRQAYRYIEETRIIGRPVVVAEPAAAVTFKLPPSLVDAVRERAAAEGMTISDMVSSGAASVSRRSRRQWLSGAAMIAASNFSTPSTVSSPSNSSRSTRSWSRNRSGPSAPIRA